MQNVRSEFPRPGISPCPSATILVRLTAAALSVLALASCNNKETSEPDTAACEETAPLYCQQLFSCSPEGGREAYGTIEVCNSQTVLYCRHPASQPGVSPSIGEASAACLRALGAQGCDDPVRPWDVEACRTPAGSRSFGEPCAEGAQCASTYCKLTASSGADSPCGVCATAPVAGEACGSYDFCAHGSVCAGGKCVVSQPAGGECTEWYTCQGGLSCLDGRCGKRRPAGADCTDFFDCEGSLHCLSGKCAQPLPEGAACTESDDCESFSCENGRCQPRPPPLPHSVDPGQPCSDEISCRGDAFCEAGTRRCALLKRSGEPCAQNECLAPLVCRDGQCQARIASTCSKG